MAVRRQEAIMPSVQMRGGLKQLEFGNSHFIPPQNDVRRPLKLISRMAQ